jgi:hypothetical protein
VVCLSPFILSLSKENRPFLIKSRAILALFLGYFFKFPFQFVPPTIGSLVVTGTLSQASCNLTRTIFISCFGFLLSGLHSAWTRSANTC